MKNIYILGLLILSLSLNANELNWVDSQIDAIKPSRSGLRYSTLASLKTPVIFLEKNRIIDKDAKNKTKTKTQLATKSIRSSSSKGVIPSKKTIIRKQRKYNKNLVLDAVINKSALINGTWYTLNDTVRSYKLSEVNGNSVTLTRGAKSIKLSTFSKNKNLNFKK